MTGLWAVLITTFLASAVEAIEMVTIVVGVGATRGWRSTIIGAASGFGVLAVVVVILGAALSYIPIGPLRLVFGSLLLVFGLQWGRSRGTRGGHHRGQLRRGCETIGWSRGRRCGSDHHRRWDRARPAPERSTDSSQPAAADRWCAAYHLRHLLGARGSWGRVAGGDASIPGLLILYAATALFYITLER